MLWLGIHRCDAVDVGKTCKSVIDEDMKIELAQSNLALDASIWAVLPFLTFVL